MPKKTYTLECQRSIPGQGCVPCEPHQASRIVILEVTVVPAKGGRPRQRISRNFRMFYGAGGLAEAREMIDRLTRGTLPRPKTPGIWGRSCTQAEYNDIMSRRNGA